jgi:twitching motility protein PilI
MVNNPDLLPENSQDMAEDLPEGAKTPEGELYLRFYLPYNDEFALPATGIREVMQQMTEQVTPIPNASPLLLGAINLRGQIIWIADLGQFLGNPVPLNTDRGEISVIAIEEEDQETILGLAVERLGKMEWLLKEQLQISTNVPDHIAPYVLGEWSRSSEAEGPQTLRLLDHLAILRSARWAA